MEYYFNEIDPVKFQRLVNAILIEKYGDAAKLTPLRGRDGGSDGEVNPEVFFEVLLKSEDADGTGYIKPPEPGSEAPWIFQVKHRRTMNYAPGGARRSVLKDLENTYSYLKRQSRSFSRLVLVTNVESSLTAINELAALANAWPERVSIWWNETLQAHLDTLPQLWMSFPEIFAGGAPPVFAQLVAGDRLGGELRALRTAISRQFERDTTLKFRQIDLQRNLVDLFVNLRLQIDTSWDRQAMIFFYRDKVMARADPAEVRLVHMPGEIFGEFSERNVRFGESVKGVELLLREKGAEWPLGWEEGSIQSQSILIQGGPGQGKSTLTQLVAQLYRYRFLGLKTKDFSGWGMPSKRRLPLRVELKRFSEFLADTERGSLEMFLARQISEDSGGARFEVNDLQSVLELGQVILLLDGLDEVGTDEMRDLVMDACLESIARLRKGLKTDLKVVLTTRPPAISGRRGKLKGFIESQLQPMSPEEVTEFMERWTAVQLKENEERKRVRESFMSRRREPHVGALVRNPMQLSVLLHLIFLKGEAFPDRRSELYREYFKTVIDRDVEKSSELRRERDTVESLHRFLGFELHRLTEVERADGSFARPELLERVRGWLSERKENPLKADRLFRLGEERLGLIVILRGEGDNARYGFEVQPIREYFAAAFVNEDLERDATEYFTKMVRRAYWREVALFLAGLRRPKEKADLLSAARQLDEDAVWGWRQDGREIILQLLTEGVLSHPRYVFTDSLRYVLELLDVREGSPHREPAQLVPRLQALVEDGWDVAWGRFESQMAKYLREGRVYAAQRIAAVLLCRATTTESFAAQILALSSADANQVKLLVDLPHLWAGTFKASFWLGVVGRAPTFERPLVLSEIAQQGELFKLFDWEHLSNRDLLAAFAVQAVSRWQGSLRELLNVEQVPGPALLGYLVNWIYKPDEPVGPGGQRGLGRSMDILTRIADRAVSISFDDLSQGERSAVEQGIEIFTHLGLCLASMPRKKQSIEVVQERFLALAEDAREAIGLEWWVRRRIALLYASTLMRMFRVLGMSLKEVAELHKGHARMITRFDNALHGGDYIGPVRGEAPELPSWQYRLWRRAELGELGYSIPLSLRDSAGRKSSTVDIFRRILQGSLSQEFAWVEAIPLAEPLVGAVVASTTERKDLKVILRNLGSRRVQIFDTGGGLRLADIHRIAAIVRRTTEASVLRGALPVLAHASFLKIFGVQEVAKMLRVSGQYAEYMSKIFSISIPAARSGSGSRLVSELAGIVESNFSEFPLEIGVAAMKYRAEHEELALDPLEWS